MGTGAKLVTDPMPHAAGVRLSVNLSMDVFQGVCTYVCT